MPTYDYACRLCKHTFEHFQGISDPLKRKCPKCGRMGLDRLFGTGIGVVFKGSGFYETDYKRAPKKDAAPEKNKSSAANPSKDSKTSTKNSGDSQGGSSKDR
ncbi:MAG: putative FmdB family regulatory protein [Pseudohongiellaceae bacterium]|jgi:putative FmdB family regulatory protein